MMRTIWHTRWLGVLIAASVVPTSVGAQPQLLATGTRTIFLDASAHSFSVPSTVTYHPGFDRYYTSDTGNPTYPAFVFPSTGGVPEQTLAPMNVDPRAWNFNLNTGALEIVTYNAVGGGAGLGLIAPGIDGTGMLTGDTTQLLPSMPGNDGSQTAPAYDPIADVFYSRSASNSVNVVRRSDGSLAGTILLDFTSAGIAGAYSDGIAFVPEAGYLGVLDSGADQLVVFDRVGAFVGSVALDITLTSAARRLGYTNGQLFAFDAARGGWQGYEILDTDCLVDADCDDGNECTDDVCDASLRCVYTDGTGPCNDGDACSLDDTCQAGACVGTTAGFDGLACLLRRLRKPDLCTDGVPKKLGRFVGKRAAKTQTLAESAERTLAEGGNPTRSDKLLGKADKTLGGIGVKVAKAEASSKAKLQITTDCANTIDGLVNDADTLLSTLP
jgi:hypothetical protein